jgi:hypothetical protein
MNSNHNNDKENEDIKVIILNTNWDIYILNLFKKKKLCTNQHLTIGLNQQKLEEMAYSFVSDVSSASELEEWFRLPEFHCQCTPKFKILQRNNYENIENKPHFPPFSYDTRLVSRTVFKVALDMKQWFCDIRKNT